MPKVWTDWTSSEAYSGWQGLREHFKHVDKMLDVKKDLAFSSCIVGAGFDLLAGKWNSKAEDGRTMRSRFLIIAKDFAAKRHFHD
jgi:cation diffusion facilitator CzcD-associated flavoprotein CzcO